MKMITIYIILLSLLTLAFSAAYILSWLTSILPYNHRSPIILPPDLGAALYLSTIGLLLVYSVIKRGEAVSRAAALIASLMAFILASLQLLAAVSLLLSEIVLGENNLSLLTEIMRPEIILGVLSVPIFYSFRKGG